MLGRPRAQKCYEHFRQAHSQTAASLLSFHFVMYYAEKAKISGSTIKRVSNRLIWLPLTEDDMQWAFEHYDGKDYEDALQIAIALREGCREFVTIDKKLAKKYGDQLKITLIQ